jgi:hypothetical protein
MLNVNLTAQEDRLLQHYRETITELAQTERKLAELVDNIGAVQGKYKVTMKFEVVVEERQDKDTTRAILLNDTDSIFLKRAICKELEQEIVRVINENSLFTKIEMIE